MSNVVEALRYARKIPQRYLLQYLNLRSRIGSDIFITVFEGKDDIPVYDIWISQITRKYKFEPMQTNGKENVISLAGLIHSSREISDKRVFFFIDHDFDGALGVPEECPVYVTQAYSIENFLVGCDILERILINDFGLVGDSQKDRPALIKIFEQRKEEFKKISAPINGYVRWLRLETDCEDSLPSNTSKAISVSLDKVESLIEMTPSGICTWLNASAAPTTTTLNEQLEFLNKGDLSILGRGKFLFDFLKRFLAAAYDDKRSSKPLYFSVSDKSCPDPTQNLLRKTATYALLPECLKSFIESNIKIAIA